MKRLLCWKKHAKLDSPVTESEKALFEGDIAGDVSDQKE